MQNPGCREGWTHTDEANNALDMAAEAESLEDQESWAHVATAHALVALVETLQDKYYS